MAAKDTNKDSQRGKDGWQALQRHQGKLILVAIVASLLFHLLSVTNLGERQHKPLGFNQQRQPPVKIRVLPSEPEVAKKAEEPVVPPEKKLLETPQQKTQAPDEASYLGTVDHKAKKETRVSEQKKRERGADAGQKGRPDAPENAVVQADRPEQTQPQKSPKTSDIKIKSKTGSLSMGGLNTQPRNDYEALLPTSIADLPGQLNAGFQDYVDDKVEEGDRIDINTTEYRFIGYFTGMRKAIELVWNYPTEASRRGMQGEVGLEFAIGKDGKATSIRVIKSSGYPILDRAIVEAIKLASPFSPLPPGFGRNRLVVTGSFRYILSAYGSH